VYGRAQVFLQPARREGFGLTPVEAMASGCALVTTDHGGSRDYAFEGRTARLVPFDDPVATADAIEALLDDAGQRDALAAAGRTVTEQFDWDRAAEILEGHLERYLADPAALQHEPTDAPMFLDDEW
jgi:glycosyltransferase involved in cell wall biosynthesis